MASIKPARHKGKKQDLRREAQFLEAAYSGNIEQLHRLIKIGIDVDTCDEHGTTALSFAALQGKTAAVKLLLEKGADTEKANLSGFTPLFRAAARGHVRDLRLLIQAGADLTARDNLGATILHSAARYGKTSVTTEILTQRRKYGIDIEARDEKNRTPLLLAAAANTHGAMKKLIEAGADMDAHDEDGKGLMDHASQKNKPVLLELLAMKQAQTVRRAWARSRKRSPAPAP